MGAFSVDSRAYAEAIRLIETGRFPLARMHTHTFGLSDVSRAIETLAGEVPGEDAVHVAVVPGLSEPRGAALTGLRSDEGATREGSALRRPECERER
jgi:uncharacterized membrane-anchored protein